MKFLAFGFSILLALSCGTERVKYVTPDDGGSADPGGGGGSGDGGGGSVEKPSYAEVQAILNKNCVGCHGNSPFMKSEGGLRGSNVLGQVRTRNMPPNADALPEEERKLLLAFF